MLLSKLSVFIYFFFFAAVGCIAISKNG